MWADAESVAPPTVLTSTATLPASGGSVVVTGTGFSHMRRVLMGTQDLDFAVTDDGNMTITVPTGQRSGIHYLIIETRGGQVYPPPQIIFSPVLTSINIITGTAGGGQSRILTGVGFISNSGSDAVYLYDGALASVSHVVDSNTQITITTPSHAPGQVNFSVYNTDGGGTPQAPDNFTYIA